MKCEKDAQIQSSAFDSNSCKTNKKWLKSKTQKLYF